MSLDLPGSLVDAFQFVGLPWPGIEEDDLRDWARSCRGFAADLASLTSQSHQTVAGLDSATTLAFTEALGRDWQQHAGQIAAMHGPLHAFATALDAAAAEVVIQKEAVITAAGVLAAALVGTQGEAIFTLGIAEGEVPVEVAIARTAVRFCLQELEGKILGVLVGQACSAISGHVNGSIRHLLSEGAKVGAGAQALKVDTDALRNVATTLGSHSSNLERTAGQAHRANSGRKLASRSHGGRWHVAAILEQALLKVAEDVFRRLPGAIGELYQRSVRALEHAARRIEHEEDHLAHKVPSVHSAKDHRLPSAAHQPIHIRALDEVRTRARNMKSVAKWGLENPRANGIEALKRVIRFDPIDVASGDMILTQTGISLPGLLPLILSRTHVSSYRMGSWFGISWASTLDQRLEADNKGVYVTTADGMTLIYPVPSPGAAVLPIEGPRWPLRQTDDGYSLTQPQQGQHWHFAGSTGQLPLTAITDRNGNRIDIQREPDGTPTEVIHSGGYRVRVHTDTHRVVALGVLDPDGAETTVVRFEYSEHGDLTAVINSSGLPLRYDYDQDGRIVSWIDRIGTGYRYTYDDAGRCVATQGSDGILNGTLSYGSDGRTTAVDSLGHATVYEITEHTQVASITDALGNVTRFTWDRYDRKLSATDPLGRTTRWIRDEHGDVRRVEHPDGTVEHCDYNHQHQPTRITATDGAVYQYTYDERGNPLTHTDPTGAATTYTSDHRGALTAAVDAMGGRVEFETDAAGLPLACTDPLGRLSTITRDAFGRATAFTDPAGGTSHATYNAEGDILTSRTPTGAGRTWSYDGERNLLEHRDPTGAATRMEYGPFDRVTARTTADGARYEFGYDTELRLTTVTNPHGLQWTYTYDAAGRLTAERDFDGRQITYELDPAGQLRARTDAGGDTFTYTRDARGRLTTATDQLGEATTLAYDPAGRLLRAASSTSTVTYIRDPLGRVLTEAVDGRVMTYAYDALGRRTSRTTPSGITSTWTYNADSSPAALSGIASDITFDYDDAGREISQHFGHHVALTRTWDADHRLTAQTLTGAVPAVGISEPSLHRTYTYRPDGTPTAITDNRHGDRHFDLDATGRITAVRAETWTETYAYDQTGNVTHTTGPTTPDTNGPRTRTGTSLRTAGRTTYTHDPKGRLTTTARRTLDGRRLTTTYTWNTRDQLTTATLPDNTTWHYTYDPLGRRTGKRSEPTPHHPETGTTFTWDATRIAEQTTPETNTLTWDYNPGTYRPITQTRTTPNPTTSPNPTTAHLIITDLIGTPTDLIAPNGTTTWHHKTTTWGTPLSSENTPATDCPLRFPGQYEDQETGLHYNLNRYYDPRTATYISPDPIGLAGGPNPNTYAKNVLTGSDPLGLAHCPAGGEQHTYYVEAGDTPVLVHNCQVQTADEAAHSTASENAARSSRPQIATGGLLWVKGHKKLFELSSDRLHPLINANMDEIPAAAYGGDGEFFGSHVEVQAATIIRILAKQSGSSDDLTGRLMISMPGGPCRFCMSKLAGMLPANSSLTVRSQLGHVFSEIPFP